MLSKYIQLKFSTVIIPNSLQEKKFGGAVSVAAVPASALNVEFEALKLTGVILGFTIGGALDGNGKPVEGVYQITWWNPQQNNSNNTKRIKHP